MENLIEQEYLINALKKAQPSWRAEGVGVRGNPVEMSSQQAKVEWPPPTIVRNAGRDQSLTATAGSPQAPTTVPATG